MKPILFNTEMVKAILDGRKTVTRRVVKPKYSNTHFEFKHDKYGTTFIELQNDIERAIKKLREIQPIKQITVVVCAGRTNGKELSWAIECGIQALEKQIPKKPKIIRNITLTGSIKPTFSEGECPNCGEYVDSYDNRYVCGQSGCYQALDWSK